MNKKELVKYFYEVIVSENMLDELPKYISENCVQRTGVKTYLIGVDGMKQHLLALKKTYPDYTMKIIRQYIADDYVISEFIMRGTHKGDDDDKIRLNQRKPSKYKGLSRFGPEKNLQRINKFMKERPIFYKNLIQMKENFRFYLRCFYCITKVVILQFNSENRTELARNG